MSGTFRVKLKTNLEQLGQRAVTYYTDTGLCVFCDACACAEPPRPHCDHCDVGKVADQLEDRDREYETPE